MSIYSYNQKEFNPYSYITPLLNTYYRLGDIIEAEKNVEPFDYETNYDLTQNSCFHYAQRYVVCGISCVII